MASRPRDFKSLASTSFAIRAWRDDRMLQATAVQKKKAPEGALKMEAEVGIEPAYADLQSAA